MTTQLSALPSIVGLDCGCRITKTAAGAVQHIKPCGRSYRPLKALLAEGFTFPQALALAHTKETVFIVPLAVTR